MNQGRDKIGGLLSVFDLLSPGPLVLEVSALQGEYGSRLLWAGSCRGLSTCIYKVEPVLMFLDLPQILSYFYNLLRLPHLPPICWVENIACCFTTACPVSVYYVQRLAPGEEAFERGDQTVEELNFFI